MIGKAVADARERVGAASIRASFGRLSDARGAAALWGAMASLVLILAAAGVLDAYRLSTTRDWAYQVASDAALRGVSRGRDFASLTGGGVMKLDEGAAVYEAMSAASAALAEKGVSSYVLDARALPQGGTIYGFPPVARASQSGETNWSSTEPAVGVYLEVPVSVVFFGWVNGARTVPVHAFGAAGLANVR